MLFKDYDKLKGDVERHEGVLERIWESHNRLENKVYRLEGELESYKRDIDAACTFYRELSKESRKKRD